MPSGIFTSLFLLYGIGFDLVTSNQSYEHVLIIRRLKWSRVYMRYKVHTVIKMSIWWGEGFYRCDEKSRELECDNQQVVVNTPQNSSQHPCWLDDWALIFEESFSWTVNHYTGHNYNFYTVVFFGGQKWYLFTFSCFMNVRNFLNNCKFAQIICARLAVENVYACTVELYHFVEDYL